MHRCLGLAVGGAPGARLAARLAMPVGTDTLLRAVRAMALPKTGEPRVVGLDDWAWRRGPTYGTLVVDLERRCPIALLPDRQAETVAAWLAAHPSVEVVARDRASACAEGARQGAPQAQQVADRWHLLRNLGDALIHVLERHRGDLAAAHAALEQDTAAVGTGTASVRSFISPRRATADPSPVHAERQARFETVRARHDQGWTQTRIAEAFGLDRKTVRAWLRAGRPPAWRQPPRGSCIEPFEAHLRRRWGEGCEPRRPALARDPWAKLRGQTQHPARPSRPLARGR